ncbi:MAG: hypothetical protein V7756_12300 [Halopseudomonas sp.]|uniref:hypothetical protein n=1 Tax=Halopseudomonas sp. TaxID=2901191 RepID=UPI003001202D
MQPANSPLVGLPFKDMQFNTRNIRNREGAEIIDVRTIEFRMVKRLLALVVYTSKQPHIVFMRRESQVIYINRILGTGHC